MSVPVTVVIPAFDRAELILRALNSVARQTVQPAEVLVVDDASRDGTPEVAITAGARVIRHAENRGAAAARNTGFAASSGEWVALLDSDDEWLPWHLERLWGAREGCVLVSASALILDPDGAVDRALGPPGWHDRLVRRPEELVYPENVVVNSGALVRRDVVVAVDGYDTSLRYAEDFDLWTRVLEHGTARCLCEVGVLMRQHAGRKSGQREGATAAQARIADRIGRRGRDARRAAQRRLGVRHWDDLRAAHREGRRAVAVRSALSVATHPQELAGVAGIWSFRWRARRRGRAVLPDGRLRIAVLSGDPPSPGAAAQLEDWRDRPRAQRLRALAAAPPRAVVAQAPGDRLLCRALRVAVLRGSG